MKYYNLFTKKQLEWMNKEFKTTVSYKGQDLSSCYKTKTNIFNKRSQVPADKIKLDLLKENISWQKHNFNDDARRIPDEDFSHEQITALNGMICNPEWQEYISSQASADFFNEKRAEVEKDINGLITKEVKLSDKLCGENRVQFHRNWFQEKIPFFRFKENKFINNTKRELRTVTNEIRNARLMVDRLDIEVSIIDLRAKEFEAKHEKEIKDLFSGKPVIRTCGEREGIVNKAFTTYEEKAKWDDAQRIRKNYNDPYVVRKPGPVNLPTTIITSNQFQQQLTPSLNLTGGNK